MTTPIIPELLPCSVCGAGETRSEGKYLSGVDMDGKPRSLINWEIYHWCEKNPGVVAQSFTVRGREQLDAVNAYNSRPHTLAMEEALTMLVRVTAELHQVTILVSTFIDEPGLKNKVAEEADAAIASLTKALGR